MTNSKISLSKAGNEDKTPFGVRVYNTLTKKVEEIEKKDHLNLYTCGPTVYNYAHIGNLRAFIMADLLYRTLKYEGYNPKWVMNITDIDDKTIKGTIEKFGKDATVKALYNFTEEYYQGFLNDLREVNVLVDEIKFIRVADKTKEIQDFVIKLMDKGYAYKAEDGVYFSIEKYQKDFGDYGQLVGEKFLEGKKTGARVAVDEYEKDNLSDFALWKSHNVETDGQIFWDHPVLGKGRPGWHIECSVINHIAFNGEPTDIHTGGVDLIFPHHTNEIAQSQALLGKGNFVNHWFHSEHLLVDGKKMAKKLNNFYTLKDLERHSFNYFDLRYFFCNAHYRVQENFTWDALEAAHQGLFRNTEKEKKKGSFSNKELEMALEDDLNIPDAVASVHSQNLPLTMFSDIFGLGKTVLVIPDEVQSLLDQRKLSKEQKDFTKSDEIRKQIEALGYEVMDTPEGQKIRKKISI